MCVCVCGRERERERQRQRETDRQTDRQTDKQTETEIETKTRRGTTRERNYRGNGGNKERHTHHTPKKTHLLPNTLFFLASCTYKRGLQHKTAAQKSIARLECVHLEFSLVPLRLLMGAIFRLAF